MKRVLVADPDLDAREAPLEFRLTYAGPLYAAQRDSRPGQPSRHIENKHHIRMTFHRQLRELWRQAPSLNGSNTGPGVLIDEYGKEPLTKVKDLSAHHAHYGFNFVPLVTQELDLLCGLDILFLRRGRPGDAIWPGDIDNRLKTLLDALRIPEAAENYSDRTPTDDETPLFVLLEEDKLVSSVSVDTDRLLEDVDGSDDAANVRLVITVKIKPYSMHLWNLHLG